MPIDPFGEILGTTGTLESLGEGASKYKSKVNALRNPELLTDGPQTFQVHAFYSQLFHSRSLWNKR